jgi:hypothetical protein
MTDFTAASAGGEPHRGGIRSSQGSHGFWQYPRALNDEPSGTGVGRAFYGGLGDLLATAAMGDWPAADHLTIAYALSSWRPTPATRATGRVTERRNGRRIADFLSALSPEHLTLGRPLYPPVAAPVR